MCAGIKIGPLNPLTKCPRWWETWLREAKSKALDVLSAIWKLARLQGTDYSRSVGKRLGSSAKYILAR
jgi:hypothetical protein